MLAVTPNLIRLTDLTQTMISYMKDLGIKETKESFKTHLRRKLEAEFGSLLQFEHLLGNNSVFIIPANLSQLQLANIKKWRDYSICSAKVKHH